MFTFEIADFVPYRNREVLDRVRKISGKDLERHPNPNFRITVMSDPGSVWIADMVARIQRSDMLNERLTMVLPNPCPTVYEAVTKTVNMLGINCRNVHVFTMDEWADQDGNIAPTDYQAGFSHSCLKYFWGGINEKLRMPLEQIHYPTTKNIKDYSAMLTECGRGGADKIGRAHV